MLIAHADRELDGAMRASARATAEGGGAIAVILQVQPGGNRLGMEAELSARIRIAKRSRRRYRYRQSARFGGCCDRRCSVGHHGIQGVRSTAPPAGCSGMQRIAAGAEPLPVMRPSTTCSGQGVALAHLHQAGRRCFAVGDRRRCLGRLRQEAVMARPRRLYRPAEKHRGGHRPAHRSCRGHSPAAGPQVDAEDHRIDILQARFEARSRRPWSRCSSCRWTARHSGAGVAPLPGTEPVATPAHGDGHIGLSDPKAPIFSRCKPIRALAAGAACWSTGPGIEAGRHAATGGLHRIGTIVPLQFASLPTSSI